MDGGFAEGYAIGADRSNSGNDGFGFGNGGAWIWIILILAIFGGFGGRGFGGGSDWQRSSVQDSYVLASDFSQLDRKMDSLGNGIASLGYDQLGQINGVNANISNLGYQLQGCCCDVREAISGVNYNNAMNMNALQKQIGDCCCENRAAVAQVRYDMSQNTRDIVDNANANTRAILDYLCQDKIQTLQSENQALRLKASQEAQNNYLVNALRPCPSPAYVVPNPFCCNQGNTCSGNVYGI